MKKSSIWENAPVLRLIVQICHAVRVSSQRRVINSPHYHSFYELGFVRAGECVWKLSRRRRVKVQAGQVILLRPGTSHYEEFSAKQETEVTWVGLDCFGRTPQWAEKVVSLDEDFNEIAATLQTIYREHSATDFLTRKRVALALQSTLVLVSRRAENKGPRQEVRRAAPTGLNARQARSIESAAHYFQNNFQESLSMAQVAAYHSFCPAYFSTLFRRRYRISPRSFLRQVKVDKAAELLAVSDLTIKEIGAQCGFVDAAHLSKAFKEKHRITPGAFRRKNRS